MLLYFQLYISKCKYTSLKYIIKIFWSVFTFAAYSLTHSNFFYKMTYFYANLKHLGTKRDFRLLKLKPYKCNMETALLTLSWLRTNKFFPDRKQGWKFCCLSVVEIIIQDKVSNDVSSSALCLFVCTRELLHISSIIRNHYTSLNLIENCARVLCKPLRFLLH